MIIDLKCACGAVRGSADLSSGVRVVCHCDDCRAYARALQRDDVLDGNGGTDVVQTRPAAVAFTTGREHVRCLRLTDRGLMRWHTGCCRTPLANTMPSPRVPFVGVVHACWDLPVEGRAALGEPVGTQGRFAVGGVPAGVHARAPVGLMLRAAAFLIGGVVRGAHRPSPFFDDAGAPLVAPRVLAAAEREALR